MRKLVLLIAAFAVAGCGDDEKPAAAPAPTPTPTATISANLKEEPIVAKPAGSPPTKLVTRDIVTGKGPRVKRGDVASVQYTGVSWSTGQKFDASWDRGAQPLQFRLAPGEVIPGWVRGVQGMRVGGRRELVIPPGLAYGPQGQPPVIGPNETLIFVVDLVGIG